MREESLKVLLVLFMGLKGRSSVFINILDGKRNIKEKVVLLINKDGSINRWGFFSGNFLICFIKLDFKEKSKDVECKRI